MQFANALTGLILGLTLLFTAPLGAVPQIQSWYTPNGARVLFVAAPELPMLDLRLVFNAGSARDARPGIASLTSMMLTQGAGAWNADQIAERLEAVGADLGTGALRDMAWVKLRSLTQQPAFGTALETLTTLLGDPTFPPADLERLRNLTLVALNQETQEPHKVGTKALYQALYGDHPYAHDPMGTPDTVAELTRTEVLEHFRRYYVAKNVVVALVGAVERSEAEQIAAQVTAGLATGEAAPPLPAVAELTQATQTHLPFPSSQSHVYVGQPGIQRHDADFFPLVVGNHILGGSGLVSLLSDAVREKRGLSYSVYSYFIPMQQRGPFMLGLQTKNAQAEQALGVLNQTLAQFIQNGPTAAELTAAQQNITGGFPLGIASNAKIVEQLAVIGFYDLPLDYLDTYNARVLAVTAEQIRDAFQRRIHPERFVTLVVGADTTAASSD